MKNPVIGVTERGDPSLDFGWISKLDAVDGAVIITKNLTRTFRKALLPYAEKCILHASITGYGATVVEPNLPRWEDTLSILEEYVQKGFPKDHVVVRVDPIIPTPKGIALADKVIRAAYAAGFHRVRFSVLDSYRHVQARFDEANISLPYEGFAANETQFSAVQSMIDLIREECSDIVLEVCAERSLKNVRHCGCVSEYDLNILNLPFDEIDSAGHQRPDCMCYSGKRELLNRTRRCPYQCLYCYWRD